jgi:hypothetical protein
MGIAVAGAAAQEGGAPGAGGPSTDVASRPISPGERVEGELAAGSPIFRGSSSDAYELQLESEVSLVLSLESGEFDAYLTVIGPDGQEYTDDDGGLDTNALLRLPGVAAGAYRIYVSSYGGFSLGRYRLSVARYESGAAASEAPATRIRVGQSVEGGIGVTSPVYEGKIVAVYEVLPTPGAPVSILLLSAQMDAYLYVITPDGFLLEDDDSGGLTNSLVTIDAARQGPYRIYATSYGGQTTGTFILSVE